MSSRNFVRGVVGGMCSGTTVLVISLLSRPVQTQMNVPAMGVGLVRCEAQAYGQLGPGPNPSDNRGFGNSTSERTIEVSFEYYHPSSSTKVGAANRIQRIELCWSDATGNGHCPGTNEWLYFDRSPGDAGGMPQKTSIDTNKIAPCSATLETIPGQGPQAPMARCGVSADLVQKFTVPVTAFLDWGNPGLQNAALFLRVATDTSGAKIAQNLTPDEVVAQALANGICPTYSIRAKASSSDPASSANAQIVGPNPGYNPFGADPANPSKSKLVPCFGPRMVGQNPELKNDNLCISDAQAEYYRRIAIEAFRNQDNRLQAGLAAAGGASGAPAGPDQKHQAWKNGAVANSNATSPASIIMFNDAFVNNAGIAKLHREDIQRVDPANDTPATLTTGNPPGFSRPAGANGAPSALTETPTHELLHMLQDKWSADIDIINSPARTRMDALVGFTAARYFTEAQAQSVQDGACLFNYPRATSTSDCVSHSKMPGHSGSFYDNSNRILDQPVIDTVLTPYWSQFFWNYIYQQFSYPRSPPNLAHPAGSASAPTTEASLDTRREPTADSMALVDRKPCTRSFITSCRRPN